MKIIAIADDDSQVGNFRRIGTDVLLSLGDIHEETIRKAALYNDSRHILAVKGNHDLPDPFSSPIIDLHGISIDIDGVKFGGFCGSWKYKPKGHHLFTQLDVSNFLQDFPGVDVFIAHNSPRGLNERDDNIHQGFEAFIEYIEGHEPAFFIHGHQHFNGISKVGNTTIISVFGEMIIEI